MRIAYVTHATLLVCSPELERVITIYGLLSNDLLLVLVPVGLCCNLLSLLVLGRDKTMNHTTRFLLQMLAIADNVFILIYPMLGLMYSQGLLSTRCREAIAFTYYMCLSPIVHMASVWLAVIVTVERYIAVSWSLRAARTYHNDESSNLGRCCLDQFSCL